MVFLACKARWVEGAVGGCWGRAGGGINAPRGHAACMHARSQTRAAVEATERPSTPLVVSHMFTHGHVCT